MLRNTIIWACSFAAIAIAIASVVTAQVNRECKGNLGDAPIAHCQEPLDAPKTFEERFVSPDQTQFEGLRTGLERVGALLRLRMAFSMRDTSLDQVPEIEIERCECELDDDD
jgi:hypothetical protein